MRHEASYSSINFNRDCSTEAAYVNGAYQNQKYFWFSADNASGLLYRFDSSLNPTDKTNKGSVYSFAQVQADQSLLGNNTSQQQIILNNTYTGSGIGYLQYRFYDNNSSFEDNTGGYVLGIKHTKCVRKNGSFSDDIVTQRGLIEYVVASYGQNPNTSISNLTVGNLNPSQNGSGSFSVSSSDEGYLWLRIKNDPNDYKNSYGQYAVQLSTSTAMTGFYNDIIGSFFDDFKGKIKGGAVTIFKNMTCYQGLGNAENCINFFSYIQGVLTLYIIIFGMMFLLGLVKISQTDLVIRITKIAIVAGLINGSTFEFFSSYILTLVTEFSDTIIANMSGYSLYGIQASSNPLMFMDEILTRIFFSSTFAFQIMALLSMGFGGVIYFILMVVAIGIIVLVLFKTIAVYMMSYMAITVLIGLAPLFLTFILFEKTRYLFENWVKFTFRYMMQPVILLAGVIVLVQLVTIYLDFIVGYSVCWKCVLPIKIPLIGLLGVFPDSFVNTPLFCISWFAPWGLDYNTTPMGLSMQNIVVFMIFVYCLWGYVKFADDSVPRI